MSFQYSDRLTAKRWWSSDDTCQPMPRLITEGGHGVALAYRETAMKAPVDCITKQAVLFSQYSMHSEVAVFPIYLTIIRYPPHYLHKSNKRSCHHGETFTGIESWCSPLERVRYTYPANCKATMNSIAELQCKLHRSFIT